MFKVVELENDRVTTNVTQVWKPTFQTVDDAKAYVEKKIRGIYKDDDLEFEWFEQDGNTIGSINEDTAYVIVREED
jgi:hypothetical protein